MHHIVLILPINNVQKSFGFHSPSFVSSSLVEDGPCLIYSASWEGDQVLHDEESDDACMIE